MQNLLSTVSDVCNLKGGHSATHTVSPQTPVFDAVNLMNQNNIGSLVVEQYGRVAGIFTERDVLVRVVAADRDPHNTPVEDVMTRDPMCVDQTMSARELMVVATEKRCRHFPIVEDDKLIGLVSTGDLVRWETRDQESRIDAGLRAIKLATGR